jgi:hypothetical protein
VIDFMLMFPLKKRSGHCPRDHRPSRTNITRTVRAAPKRGFNLSRVFSNRRVAAARLRALYATFGRAALRLSNGCW